MHDSCSHVMDWGGFEAEGAEGFELVAEAPFPEVLTPTRPVYSHTARKRRCWRT